MRSHSLSSGARLQRIAALLAALAFTVTAGAAPATAVAAPGPVAAIGGGLRDDNAVVWARLVELAGGRGARIAVLPTAASDPEESAASTAAALRRHGAEAVAIPVAPNWPASDALAAARDPRWVAQIERAQGVFFTGGDQARIVDTLAPAGEATPLLTAIRALHARGGLVAGTSAGAAVLSQTMIRDIDRPIDALKGRLRDGHELGAGLGFVREGVLVDQHFLERGRLGRLLPVMASRGLPLGIGVGEDTAAILRGDALEVVGRGGVLLVELDPAAEPRAPTPLTLRDVRIALLAGGDRADLRSGVVTPSVSKQGTAAIDPSAPGFRPYHPDVPFYLDVLGAHAVRDAMTRLLDSPASEARGLAFDPLAANDDPQAALGFEFRFRKSAQARGWYAGAGDEESHTIVGLRLDVTPVRVARPLYGAWTP